MCFFSESVMILNIDQIMFIYKLSPFVHLVLENLFIKVLFVRIVVIIKLKFDNIMERIKCICYSEITEKIISHIFLQTMDVD